jgi:ferritin-like metal-binding protein YciE
MPHTVQLTMWLEQAYGVETEVIDTLTEQLPHLTGHHKLEAKVLEHLEKSHHHLNRVDECIARLGGEASSLRRGGLTTFLRGMRSQGTSRLAASPVQDCIADFAAEHYEIATYTALITAARACRDEETARVCEEILREEEEMARWLEDHLTVLARELVHPKETPEAEQETAAVDAAGALRGEHVFAVFDAADQAQQATQALSAMGVQPQRLQGTEAALHLRGESGGIMTRIQRLLKGMTAEKAYAEEYSVHLQRGRILLAVECADLGQAEQITQKLQEHGGHTIMYFGSDGNVELRQQ